MRSQVDVCGILEVVDIENISFDRYLASGESSKEALHLEEGLGKEGRLLSSKMAWSTPRDLVGLGSVDVEGDDFVLIICHH